MTSIREHTICVLGNSICLTVVFLAKGSHVLGSRDGNGLRLVAVGGSAIFRNRLITYVQVILNCERFVFQVKSLLR